MPLGYRYETKPTDSPVPGLVDSVTWNSSKYSRQYQVNSIYQKPYTEIADADPRPNESAGDGSRQNLSGSRHAPAGITEIVAFIRRRYDLDLPIPAQPAEPPATRFELNHLDEARLLARDSVPRAAEVTRILDLTQDAPHHRLLLVGPAGGGKSVLLAQIATTLEGRGEALIYLSMDHPPDPKPEPDALTTTAGIAAGMTAGEGAELASPGLAEGAPSKTLAVPVRMNLLATLLRITDHGDQTPNTDLAEQTVRERVLGLLATLADDAPVWVLIDALDQANGEPAALLSGLPRPLPAKLRVIATTRPIDAVIDAVEQADGHWQQAQSSAIHRDQTRQLLLHPWPAEDRQALAAAAGDPLTKKLLDDLDANSNGLPLWLHEWGRELHQRWLAADHDPAVFAAFCRVLDQADHRGMPPGYKKRLDQTRAAFRAGFRPAELADLLLWALALLERPLDLDRLLRAVSALAPHFPGGGGVTRDTLRAALGHLGGFVVVTGTPMDPRWRLYHSLIGAWFISEQGNPQRVSELREALVPIGIAPDLDDPASLVAWAGRILEGEPLFYDLAAPLRMQLLDRLLDGLPDGQRPVTDLARFGHRRAGLAARRAGELHKDGEEVLAIERAEAARVLAERLLADTGPDQRSDLVQDLAVAWHVVGIAGFARDKDKALDAFERALKLREEGKARFPEAWTPHRQRGLAIAYDIHGITLANLKRNDEALTEYGRAIELYQGLDQDQPEVRQGLGNALQHRAGTLQNLKRNDEALAEYGRAIELYQGLDQDKPEVRQNLGNALYNRASTLKGLKRYDEALTEYGRAIELYQGLDQDKPEVRQGLGNALQHRAGTLQNLKRYDEALTEYGRAIDLYQGLDQDQPELRQNLGNAYYNRGRIFYSLGQLEPASDDHDQANALGNTGANLARQSPWQLWGARNAPSSLGTYTGLLPDDEQIDWQPPPLIDGTWSALTGDAARPHLAGLASLLRQVGNTGLLQRVECEVTALRSRPLACYPGWLLCEARIGDDARAGAVPFLSSTDGAVLLSGASEPLHAFNPAIGLQLVEREAYLDYWLLFCSAVRGEKGRFQVLETPDGLTWRSESDPSQVGNLQALLKPPELSSLDGDHALISGDVLYGNGILRARFKVDANGIVEMLEDQGVAEATLTRTERFDGPIREWANDPPRASGDQTVHFARQSPWRLWGAGNAPSSLGTYTGLLPDDEQIDWQPPPLIDGDWSALTGDAARPHLAGLASLLSPVGNSNLLQRVEREVTALRSRPLACYPGWLLCEARIGCDALAGALPFLSSTDGAVLLSGTSASLHAFNPAIGLQLMKREAYLDYWVLFCSAIRGEEGRYQVIEAPDGLVWRSESDPSKVAELKALIKPPKLSSLDEDHALFSGDVLYDNGIYRARFKVHADGKVEMLEDQEIAKALLTRAEQFDGPVRQWAEDPPPASGDLPPSPILPARAGRSWTTGLLGLLSRLLPFSRGKP